MVFTLLEVCAGFDFELAFSTLLSVYVGSTEEYVSVVLPPSELEYSSNFALSRTINRLRKCKETRF